jgi:hypothetical protein
MTKMQDELLNILKQNLFVKDKLSGSSYIAGMGKAVNVIEAYLNASNDKQGWRPMSELEMQDCSSYKVSKTVLVAFHYPETNQYTIQTCRVWQNTGEKPEIIDIKHQYYDRATHFMLLPNPPTNQKV